MQDEHPVGDRVGLFQVVRGEQDRTALGGLLAHGRPERLAGGDVHAGGRLVEDDQVVGPGGRQREADALLLAARELVDLAVGYLRDPGAVHDLGDRVRLGVQVAAELDQLAYGHVLHQAAALQHRADLAGVDGLRGRHAEEADRAGVGVAQAEQQVEGGGLAGAVGAEQGDRLTGVQPQRQVGHGTDVAVALVHVLEAHHGLCGPLGGRCCLRHGSRFAQPEVTAAVPGVVTPA